MSRKVLQCTIVCALPFGVVPAHLPACPRGFLLAYIAPTVAFRPPPFPSRLCALQVHTGMAEQAFKQNVQSVLSDGNLTPDRAAALERMREQMGLPKENADKIIRGFSNQKAISGMQVGGGCVRGWLGCWVAGGREGAWAGACMGEVLCVPACLTAAPALTTCVLAPASPAPLCFSAPTHQLLACGCPPRLHCRRSRRRGG
jgi:hypothetical protein